ncbi:hypothetical protein A6D6_02203 [Alcanivorax xiamenensis]|uniref:DUF502 domain-containing protein n=1 Tax=Alcanivorax xiamenensis TaxID=1177156 RepID=A0ABQ6Y8E3_9GAMM|nr:MULTISPECIES: DUF502 domain-containing protein [Alcanivorax]KAF0805562.1 hypothetical protein A6D6_02203 [Alcanivorax xiamenensis]
MKADRGFWFFVRKSLIGGVIILLPISIIAFFFKWLYDAVTSLIAPFTRFVVHTFGLPKFAADWVVVAVLVVFCFLVGTLVATRLGSWLWQRFEARTMVRLPGYRLVKEIILQVFGKDEDSPFHRGEVAQIWLYGRQADVSVMGLITSHHGNGRVTVFVPTGPNPTTGFIYHVNEELVTRHPEVGVEQMMKSVVACGAGSGQLLRGDGNGSEIRGEQS